MADDPELLARQAAADIAYILGISVAEMLASAVAESTRVGARKIQAIAEVLDRRLGNPEDMRQAHYELGKAAQRSVLASYGQTVTRRETPAGKTHYRAGATDEHSRRFAGGVLKRALGRPDFFEATAHGLGFINTTMLDKEAMHWRRLAFGAGGKGAGSHQRFQVGYGSLILGTLGLDEDARPAFRLPPGVFVSPEGNRVAADPSRRGQDPFYPQGERGSLAGQGIRGRPGRARMTEGIEARLFLDAGVRRLARELPGTYERLYDKWWAESLRGGGPLHQVVSVRPPRPVPLRSSVRRFR